MPQNSRGHQRVRARERRDVPRQKGAERWMSLFRTPRSTTVCTQAESSARATSDACCCPEAPACPGPASSKSWLLAGETGNVELIDCVLLRLAEHAPATLESALMLLVQLGSGPPFARPWRTGGELTPRRSTAGCRSASRRRSCAATTRDHCWRSSTAVPKSRSPRIYAMSARAAPPRSDRSGSLACDGVTADTDPGSKPAQRSRRIRVVRVRLRETRHTPSSEIASAAAFAVPN
jgi:hypothetical protein